MHMMFSILDQCHTIQRECNGLKDDEISSFQSLFQEMKQRNNTFVDLRKQETLLHDMTSNLTAIRSRCIRMFRSIYDLNRQIPWLKEKLMQNGLEYTTLLKNFDDE